MTGRRSARLTRRRFGQRLVGGLTAAAVGCRAHQAAAWQNDDPTREWESVAPIPTARSELGTATVDGAIYVVGGFGGGRLIERYDPSQNTWRTLPALPEGFGIHHPGVAAFDKAVYVVGGFSEAVHTASPACWRFDPISEQWNEIACLPIARGAHALVATADALFLFGGSEGGLGGPATDQTLRYDTASNRWKSVAPMPTAREHLVGAASAGHIHVIGGRRHDADDDVLGTVHERYDPESDAWTEAAPLPTARSGMATAANSDGNGGNGFVVLGGEVGQRVFATVEWYDATADRWQTWPDLPIARHGLGAEIVDGHLYALAGSTLGGRVENVAECHRLTVRGEPTARE